MSQKFIDDGFASYLVKDAKFVGKYQIPALPKHDSLLIPKDMIPFDKRNRVKDKDVAICFQANSYLNLQVRRGIKTVLMRNIT